MRVAKKSAVQSIRCDLLNIANKECFFQVSFIQKIIRACGEKICGTFPYVAICSILQTRIVSYRLHSYRKLFVRVAKKSAVQSIRCELLNIANKECFL